MTRKIFVLTFLAFASMIFPPSLLADSTKEIRKTFNQQYKDFRASFDNREGYSQSLADQAKAVYELAKKVYSKDEESLAVLGEFYIIAMNNQFNMDEFESVIEESIRIYKVNGNKQAVDLHIELGNYHVKNSKYVNAFDDYDDAIEYAEGKLRHDQVAGIKLMVGKLYFSHSMGNKKRFSKGAELFQEAAKYFEDKDQSKFADASFWIGKSYMAMNKKKSAIEQFNLASDVFSTIKNSQKMERMSRTFLVQALMKDGQEELASKQCLKIGAISSWDKNSDIEPLYIVQPKFPVGSAFAGKEGTVRFSFNVSLDGEAEDIKVVESEGGKSFVRAAKDAIKKWRFAPKYVDGKPVVAETFYSMEFKLL